MTAGAPLGPVRRAAARPPGYDPAHPLGCHRPRIGDRIIFEKLIQVLRFGCSYASIADCNCSATTIRERRNEWIKATAIFAGSDMQAMGVYEAARLHRLRIPDELSVVGFDDLPMSGWVSPPLTTIVQPLAQMAAMATRTVLALLDGSSDTSSNRVELATSLVLRSSTAPPGKPASRSSARSARKAG